MHVFLRLLGTLIWKLFLAFGGSLGGVVWALERLGAARGGLNHTKIMRSSACIFKITWDTYFGTFF